MESTPLCSGDLRGQQGLSAPEHLDVRSPEAIDTLALVTHHKQPCGPKPFDNGALQLVSVLKLVDHDPRRGRERTRRPSTAAVTQQGPSAQFQVGEVEQASLLLVGFVVVVETGKQAVHGRHYRSQPGLGEA
jgi:hypothetical protein